MKNLKHFLWKYGGGMDFIDKFRIKEAEVAKVICASSLFLIICLFKREKSFSLLLKKLVISLYCSGRKSANR